VKIRISTVICLLFLCVEVQSQANSWKGTVFSENNTAVASATILVRSADSARIFSYAITRADGTFLLDKRILMSGQFIVEIRHISFKDIQRFISIVNGEIIEKALDFILSPKHIELREVVIKRERPVLISTDTIQFNAGSFRTAETRKVEDLLKNIEGFSVDAQGRISFNGKAVEKVLIDGDDLADKGYRLITRNLNAQVIDKIQVIDNYHDNRLMRNVEQLDKVGINLKISSGFSNRISGSLSAGASVQKRYLADANLIYIGKPFKLLSFLNYNNIAEDPAGNVRYYYDEEGGLSDYNSKGEINYRVLSSGSIYPPEISDRYTRNNNDAGVSMICSWKIGRYTKMKGIVGADVLNLVNRSSSKTNTYISALENWATQNYMVEKIRAGDMLAKISVYKDALKKHVSRMDLDIGGGRQQNEFGNLSAGSVIDTLTERLRNQDIAIHFRWEESFLLKGNRVFKTSLVLSKEKITQGLEIGSTRYIGFFGLDSSFSLNHQDLQGDHFRKELDSRISGLNKKWQYQYGISYCFYSSNYQAAARIRNRDKLTEYIDTGQQTLRRDLHKSTAFFILGRNVRKKSFINLELQAGYAWLKNGSVKDYFPVLKVFLGISKAFSPLKSFQFRYTLESDFHDYQLIYPAGLISGNGNILNGLVFMGPVITQTWITGYHSANVYRNSQWNLNISYAQGQNQYNSSVIASPEYTETFFQPSSGNYRISTLIMGEKFIKALRSKVGFTILVSILGSRYAVNGETGDAIRENLFFEGSWFTGFKFPINLEAKGKVNLSRGSWNDQIPNTNWQYAMSQKCKITVGKKVYAALACNVFILYKGKRFSGLDAYYSFRYSQVCSFSLSAINLLNTSTIKDKIVLPFSESVSAYKLVRRYILLRMDWQF
jgi:hypothetical protein